MKLTCYIVDDEPLAIEVLEAHIEQYGELSIAGTFSNAVAAFQALQERPVDLLFLDIEMPKLSGIEFLRTLHHPPKVILTTAYREYAVEGFELDVVDYLLKPISFERFLKAMGKVSRTAKEASPSSPEIAPGPEEAFLFVQVQNRKVRIPLADILYIESQRDYVNIVTGSGVIRPLLTIAWLEEHLGPAGFLRIHRSFMVPLDKITCWSATEVEVPGHSLPVGRSYKNEVMDVLNSTSNRL